MHKHLDGIAMRSTAILGAFVDMLVNHTDGKIPLLQFEFDPTEKVGPLTEKTTKEGRRGRLLVKVHWGRQCTRLPYFPRERFRRGYWLRWLIRWQQRR